MNLDYFGSTARFHHIGVAVSSIQEVCSTCEPIYDATQGVKVDFISLHGCQLELIEPARADSPVSASLENGIKLLHVCYEVGDIEAALHQCRQHGFHIIQQPVPAAAFNQRRIAFVSRNDIGVVELLESGKQV